MQGQRGISQFLTSPFISKEVLIIYVWKMITFFFPLKILIQYYKFIEKSSERILQKNK